MRGFRQSVVGVSIRFQFQAILLLLLPAEDATKSFTWLSLGLPAFIFEQQENEKSIYHDNRKRSAM